MRTATPSSPRRLRLLASAAVVVIAPLAMTTLLAVGCGPKKEPDTAANADAGAASTTTSAITTTTTAASPTPDAAPPTTDAGAVADASAATNGYWPTPDASVAATADAGPPPACWAGFKPTGNAVADVNDLGGRCAKGMSPFVPPVKQSFRQGEKKQIPLIIPGPGCYRIIAVGGTGVKDVDLEVRDGSGKLVAADNTPDDVFPMIHPNKEWCPDAAQFLTLSIIVKKGAGEVAGAVWKR